MNKFPCTQCGLCCMHAGVLEDFPHPTDHNGVCSKFDREKHQCTIYDTRPMICRVDDFYDTYLSANLDRNHWYQYNADACNEMINHAGIDKSFLVELNTDDLSDETP